MTFDDLFQPRVSLCKSGAFLHNINDVVSDQQGGEGAVGPKDDEFINTCEFNNLNTLPQESETEYDTESEANPTDGYDDYTDADYDADIVQGREENNVHDLPVLVFEGLPLPDVDQTEEELIEEILNGTVPK